MAIEVRIPKEIKEYKEKVIFGMSIRQLIFTGIAVIVSIATYFLLDRYTNLSSEVLGYVVIFEVMPLLAFGWIKKNGLHFEKYITLIIRHNLGTQIRPYQTKLLSEYVKPKKKMALAVNKKADRGARECENFVVTKKSRKRKRSQALEKIKAAKKEYKQLIKAKKKEQRQQRKLEKRENAPKKEESKKRNKKEAADDINPKDILKITDTIGEIYEQRKSNEG